MFSPQGIKMVAQPRERDTWEDHCISLPVSLHLQKAVVVVFKAIHTLVRINETDQN